MKAAAIHVEMNGFAFQSTARLVAEIKVIIPTSQEFVEEEIEDGL